MSMPVDDDISFLKSKFSDSITTDSNLVSEWQSLKRTFNLSTDELHAKWEAFDISTGNKSNTVTLSSLQHLRDNLQRSLERENEKKITSTPTTGKRHRPFTPRSGKFNSPGSSILDSILPSSISSSARKRPNPSKHGIETPTKIPKIGPGLIKTESSNDSNNLNHSKETHPLKVSSNIASRIEKGSVVEILNENVPEIQHTCSKPDFKINVDMKKFNYRILYEKLSDSSEYLDEQIEAFTRAIQEAYSLENDDFGNPAFISQSEIVAVGRIITETPSDDKLSTIHLQSGRRIGAGMRVELRLSDSLQAHFFPGQIVAVKGSNASGSYFAVKEQLEIPLLPPAATKKSDLIHYSSTRDTTKNETECGIKVVTATGPFTFHGDLDFKPLEYLISTINNQIKPSAVILLGPFIDITHPMVAEGNFEAVDPRTHNKISSATLDDLFRMAITERLKLIDPSITVILIPHVRDSASPHPAFPQPAFNKRLLGLPRNVQCQPNPATFSLNEVVVTACSQDTIFDLARYTVKHNDSRPKLVTAMSDILAQRTVYPLFPGTFEQTTTNTDKEGETGQNQYTGSNLDIPYMGLAEFNQAIPDIIISPSRMKSLSQIINNVVIINPGLASRKDSTGEYATFSIHPYTYENEEALQEEKQMDEDNEEYTTNDVFKRIRVEIIKV